MHDPRPDLSLKICSLAAILLCALLCAFCTASILHPGGVQRLGGLLLLPGFLGLGLTQYAATFQQKASSAETVSRLYSFGGGFMIIAFVCLLLDLVRLGEGVSWPVAALGGLFLLFAAWGRVGGRLNRRWAAELRRAEESDPGDSPEQAATAPTRPSANPLVWIGTLLVFAGAAWIFYVWMGPRGGEHLSVAQTPLSLPAGATDVCYWMYAGNTAFEFSVSAPAFHEWVEEQIGRRREGFTQMEPIGQSRTVPRYRRWLPGASPPVDAVIEEGYHFGWEENGQRVDYAYDSAIGRAYYCGILDHLGEDNPEADGKE